MTKPQSSEVEDDNRTTIAQFGQRSCLGAWIRRCCSGTRTCRVRRYQPVFTDLKNPKEKSAEVEPGTVKADVVLAGGDSVVIGPTSLKLAEGTTTIVYAWGSAEENNLELAVQTIKGMHGSPNSVPGGTGGQVARSEVVPLWASLVAVATLGAAVAAWRLFRHRTAPAR